MRRAAAARGRLGSVIVCRPCRDTHAEPTRPPAPASAPAPDFVKFAVDVTGGNSGSPVIDETSGKAIGIVTHCPCPNWGTRIDRNDLVAAIAAVRASRVVGKFRPYGQGCAGSAGQPHLDHDGYPTTGATTTLVATGLAAAQAGAFLFGVSDASSPHGPLPRDLTGLGLTGCFQYHDWLLANVSVSTGTGTARLTLPVPNDPALVGARTFAQLAALDPAANPFGAVTTNGAELIVGKD